MNRYLFICIIYLLSISTLEAQSRKYVYKDSSGHEFAWIELFDSGRFEIVSGHGCMQHFWGVGMYEVLEDSILFKVFQKVSSQKEVIERKSQDKKVNVFLQVLSLQDSSVVASANIFARDSLSKKFELDVKVDSTGTKSFTVPKGKSIRYLRVSAQNYIDCEIALPEKQDTDFSIKVYLSKNPEVDKTYIGPIEYQYYLHTNGPNEILLGETLMIKQ